MYPNIPFSALNPNTQEQVKSLVVRLQSDYHDLRFNFDGAYTTSSESGYHRLALISWAGYTKYQELSSEHKVKVLKTIRDADDGQFVALIYGGEGLYNIGTFDEAPNFTCWDEARPACEWLKVLGLDGPNAPSGDSCLDLEIEALEEPGDGLLELSTENKALRSKIEALRSKIEALEADLRGTSQMLEKLRAILG